MTRASTAPRRLRERFRGLNLGTLLGTARFTATTRMAGVATTGIVSSSWRTPKLATGGAISLGARSAFRNHRISSHIGAGRGGRLTLGARTFVNEGCTIVATRSIDVGADCRIGEFVAIYDTSYHGVGRDDQPTVEAVVISDNVWIARGAVVLPGVTIGRNSVIAANSVVVGDVPANTVVAGNPAVTIRSFQEQGSWRRV